MPLTEMCVGVRAAGRIWSAAQRQFVKSQLQNEYHTRYYSSPAQKKKEGPQSSSQTSSESTAEKNPSVSETAQKSSSSKETEELPILKPPVKFNRKHLVEIESEAKSGGREKLQRFFGYKRIPMSSNLPNTKNVLFEPDVPVQEIMEKLPESLREEKEKLKAEIKRELKQITIERPEVLEDLGALRHEEARIEYKFDTPEALSLWNTGSDKSWDEGYTTVNLDLTDNKTAIFHGNLSMDVIKDGKALKAGWAGMKLQQKKAFLRKHYQKRWRNFTHLLLKVRGDGRQYKIMLHTPQMMDVTWGDSYSYALHTHGGPYWQYEKIPFSKFFFTVGGRIQDRQLPVPISKISSIGIVIMDRIEGPYRLEIEYMGVYMDRSHPEQFAYEGYVCPIFYTQGI